MNNPITYFKKTNSEKTYDVSIVSSTMNRYINLLCTLHTWINLPIKEIIIIDWCSEVEFESIIPSYLKCNENYKKIRIIRVDGFNKWVLTWAYNLGFHLSESKYILKIDSDVVVEKNFFIINNHIMNDSDEYYKCFYRIDPGLNGQFFVKKTALENIGFYNEIIETYGWDDSDLYGRLHEKGFKETTMYGLNIIKHTDPTRIKNQDVNDIIVEVNYNRLKSQTLETKPFSPDRFENKGNNKFVIKDTILSYHEDLHKKSEGKFKKVKEKYKIQDMRFIILKPFYELENRITALISTICFSRIYNYVLYIIWDKTERYDDSEFTDFFIFNYDNVIFHYVKDYNIDIDNIEFDYKVKIDTPWSPFNLNYNKLYLEINEPVYEALRVGMPNHYSYYRAIKPSEKINIILQYISKNITNDSRYNVYYLTKSEKNCIEKIINSIKNCNDKNIIICDNNIEYEYYYNLIKDECKDKYTIINKNNTQNIHKVIDFFLLKNAINIYGNSSISFLSIAANVFEKKIISIE